MKFYHIFGLNVAKCYTSIYPALIVRNISRVFMLFANAT